MKAVTPGNRRLKFDHDTYVIIPDDESRRAELTNVEEHCHELANSLRAVFVRFSLEGGQSFDWRLATIAGMEVAKLVLWNSLLN